MSKLSRCFLACLLPVICACPGTSQEQKNSSLQDMSGALSVQGWSRIDSARIYGGNELFAFIDGGADLFFEYGFQQALAIEFRNPAGKAINLELYEMSGPEAAFGICSIRSGEDGTRIDIGGGGSVFAYYLMFWTGRFYVSVAASDSTAECKSGLETIARMVDQRLSTRGGKPVMIELLPREHLLKQKYIRGYLAFLSLDVIDVEEIVPMIEGVAGSYPGFALAFLRYGSATEAERRLDAINRRLRLHNRYRHYRSRDRIALVLDTKNRTVCLGRSGPYLVFSVSSNESGAFASCRKAILSLKGKGAQASPY